MRPLKILPSILASDFARLGEEVRAVAQAGADLIHIDIMDGHFVPNISLGPPVVKAIRGLTDKPFDVHLMIAPADPYIDAFAKAGANRLIVHAEAGPHLHRSLQSIRGHGMRAGVAINPGTPADAIDYVLDLVDVVLVMTVNPGFGGQKLIPAMLEKMRRVRTIIEGRDIDIEADGGVSAENAGEIVAAGANCLVAGASIFTGDVRAYPQNIAVLREAAATGRGEVA